MDIILYLLQYIQYQHKQICWLLSFICRYIPLKQWSFDDSHSPKYQKFKIDELPLILNIEPWDYRDYIAYLKWRYKDDYKPIKPIRRRSECDIDDNCTCPRCNAPKIYLYKNNGSKGQLMCKYARPNFLLKKTDIQPLNSAVLTACIHLFLRRIASTLLCTNA